MVFKVCVEFVGFCLYFLWVGLYSVELLIQTGALFPSWPIPSVRWQGPQVLDVDLLRPGAGSWACLLIMPGSRAVYTALWTGLGLWEVLVALALVMVVGNRHVSWVRWSSWFRKSPRIIWFQTIRLQSIELCSPSFPFPPQLLWRQICGMTIR